MASPHVIVLRAGRPAREVLARCRNAARRARVAHRWLPSAEVAPGWVRQRVATGGHHIPECDVRRRERRHLVNFLDHHLPLPEAWGVFDGATKPLAPAVAYGGAGRQADVRDAAAWTAIHQQADAIRRGASIP